MAQSSSDLKGLRQGTVTVGDAWQLGCLLDSMGKERQLWEVWGTQRTLLPCATQLFPLNNIGKNKQTLKHVLLRLLWDLSHLHLVVASAF